MKPVPWGVFYQQHLATLFYENSCCYRRSWAEGQKQVERNHLGRQSYTGGCLGPLITVPSELKERAIARGAFQACRPNRYF